MLRCLLVISCNLVSFQKLLSSNLLIKSFMSTPRTPFTIEAVVKRCSEKKAFLLEISQNSQENTFARVFLLIKLEARPGFNQYSYHQRSFSGVLIHIFKYQKQTLNFKQLRNQKIKFSPQNMFALKEFETTTREIRLVMVRLWTVYLCASMLWKCISGFSGFILIFLHWQYFVQLTAK